MLEELEEEAVKAGANVRSTYIRLETFKRLVKDKKDLREVGKEIIEFGKETNENVFSSLVGVKIEY